MTPRTLISADSHVFEPLDLWEGRLPDRLRDRAPRREQVDGRIVFLVGGEKVFSLRQEAGGGEIGRGGPDIAGRLRDLETDHVAGEVIYPTIALFVLSVPDADLALGCARAYNDWAAETFLDHADVFAPVALLPVADLPGAVAELERVTELGFRTAGPPMHAPEGRPYNRPEYDPLWAMAADAGIPLSMHVGTGRAPVSERGPGGAVINYLRVGVGAQDTVAYFAAGGVLERHPGLRVVVAEAGAGWLGYVCERMDEAFEEHAQWVDPKLEAPPSEYVRRQVGVTFGAERAPMLNLEVTGADPLLWASDYPHPEGTWPKSLQAVETSLEGLPAGTIAAIAGGNAARLYRFA